MSTIEVDHLFYFSLDKKFHMMMVTMRELAIFCVFVVAAVKGFSQDAHNIRHGQAVTKVSPLTRTSPLTTATTTSTTQLGFFNFGKPQEDEEQEEAAASKSNKETGKTTQKSGSTEEYEPDAVEKLFSFMFGKPEEEPFGLKRFGKERFPEQYPATIDDWAEPVASDSKDMAVVRPLLKNTNLESRGLMLTYSASRNGWDPMKFHQAVDRKGGALVVCTTQSGLLCGGYNPKGWVGYGEARGSIAAFLFVREPSGGFIKLRKVGGAGLAQLYVCKEEQEEANPLAVAGTGWCI